jgi:hypothetical protein
MIGAMSLEKSCALRADIVKQAKIASRNTFDF